MTRARSRRRASKKDRIEVWRIVLWSGLTNLVLLSVFLGAQHLELDTFGPAYPGAPASGTPTLGRMTPKDDFSTSTLTVAKTEPDSETLEEEAMAVSTADLALSGGASVDESETLRAAPILRKSPQGGKLEIGSFKSLSVVGSPDECLDFGGALLRDAGFANEKLDVLTAVDEITIVRICASNGSVMVTCRGGQIAISPRKSRPDDQCARKKG